MNVKDERLVEVAGPINLTEEEISRVFDPLNYSYREPKHIELNNTLVTTSGGVVKNGMPVLASHYKYWPQTVKHVFINYGNVFRRKKMSLKSDVVFTTGHTIWSGGYFHWITESLPRIFLAMNANPSVEVIVPGEMPLTQVYIDSLRLIGCRRVHLLPSGRYAQIRKYLLVEAPRKKAHFNIEAIGSIRRYIRPPEAQGHPLPKSILYISRSQARGRRVVNENEVEQLIKQFGGKVARFEDMQFAEQVSVMQETNVLISIHGAGLSNLMFMDESASVIELVPDPSLQRRFAAVRKSTLANPSYARLAGVANLDYYTLLCSPTEPSKEGLDDIFVDIHKLEELLTLTLSKI